MKLGSVAVNNLKTITSTDQLPSRPSPPSSEVQNEMGILKDLRIPHDILIVVEGWPSWFFVLEGFDFKSVRIFLMASLSIREKFKAVGPADNLITEAELEDWFENHPAGLVLTQGSRVFAEWLHNGYCLNRVVYTTVDGFQISHAEVGGGHFG